MVVSKHNTKITIEKKDVRPASKARKTGSLLNLETQYLNYKQPSYPKSTQIKTTKIGKFKRSQEIIV